MTMCGSGSPFLPCRGGLKEEGGGRLGLQQVIHMLISKPKRPLFKPILRRRWKWDALASAAGNGWASAREEEDVGMKDSPSKRAKTVEGSAYPQPVPATALAPGGIEAQPQPAESLKW
jgi:hypothetical protein